MKSSLYVIYDRIAEESCPPFMARTNGVAVRYYLSSMKDMPINDYWLYRIGVYGTDDMYLHALDKPERVKISDSEDVETTGASE
jgi:hypothetical protein